MNIMIEEKELELEIKSRIKTMSDKMLTTLYEMINAEVNIRKQVNLDITLEKIERENSGLYEPGVPIYTDTKNGLKITISDNQVKREMRCSDTTYEEAREILYQMAVNKAQSKVLERFDKIPFYLVKPEVFQKYMAEKSPHINWVLKQDQEILKMLPKEQTIKNRFPKEEAEKLLQKRMAIINMIKLREFTTECPECIEKE